MWAGIRLGGNGPPASGGRYSGTNSTIRGAERGISTGVAGRYDLDGVLFDRCFTGISQSGGTGSWLGTIQRSSFKSTTPISWSPRNGQRTQYGITCSAVQNMLVGVAGQNSDNSFEGVQTGIFSQGSTLRVINSNFLNLAATGSQNAGTGILVAAGKGSAASLVVGNENAPFNNCNFQNLKRGVDVSGSLPVTISKNSFQQATDRAINVVSNTGRAVTMRNNTITTAVTGIFCGIWLDVDGLIEGNTITGNVKNGIDLQLVVRSNAPVTAALPYFNVRVQGQNTAKAWGSCMQLNACDHVAVHQNYLEVLVVPVGTSAFSYGIRVTGGQKNRLHDNYVKGITGGTSIQRVGIEIEASRENVVTCNTLVDNGESMVFRLDVTPLELKGNTLTNGVNGLVFRQNAIVGDQGTASQASGNKFTGNFSQWQHLSVGSYLQGQSIAPVLYVPSTWASNPTVPGNVYNPWPRTFLGIAQMFSIVPASANMQQNLCQSPPNSPAPKPIVIGEVARWGRDIPRVEGGIEWQAKLYLYEETVLDAGLGIADSFIQAMKDSLDQTNMALIRNGRALGRMGLVQQATALLNNSLQGSLVEGSQTFVLGKEIASYGLDSLDLDSAAIASLALIAEQCPEMVGDAVYEARALLNLLSVGFIDGNCENANKAERETEAGAIPEGTPIVNFYPNPANSKVEVFVSSDAKGDLELRDAFGRIVWKKVTEIGSTTMQVPVSELADGVYVWRFRDAKGLALNGKLALLR